MAQGKKITKQQGLKMVGILLGTKATQERIASLISEGKSLGSRDLVEVSNKKLAMSTFMRLKVRDSLSHLSATKKPLSLETLKISPSSSRNIGKVIFAIKIIIPQTFVTTQT